MQAVVTRIVIVAMRHTVQFRFYHGSAIDATQLCRHACLGIEHQINPITISLAHTTCLRYNKMRTLLKDAVN